MKHLIAISAPSGSGKTTLCKALQDVMPEIEWSVSYTTRERRSMEYNGVDYNFISYKLLNESPLFFKINGGSSKSIFIMKFNIKYSIIFNYF